VLSTGPSDSNIGASCSESVIRLNFKLTYSNAIDNIKSDISDVRFN
jgi:hypothetical protein